MAGIFISYRRDDSAGHAGRLYDRLSDHFGPDQVFMDIDTIRPGQDFVEAVRQAVGGCDGLVAIIGREWLTISDATGARRLDDPEDLVSLEIATALERGIRVVPVLVQGASMPTAADFPESLKGLAHRNAQEVSDRSFRSDVQSLIEALEAPEPETQESDDFVGRQSEMAELGAALDAAIAGRGQMIMLSGEPGIGKTRLAQELASRAQSLGAQVMWGWCYEHAGAPPYWPFVQPIRAYVQEISAEQLRSQMGPGAADIADVVPEVLAKLPDLEMPAALDPDQARFRLFDSFATFFKNAAQTQPMMLVLEDLHWADKPSLLLLEFLASQIADCRLLVLGTYRDAELTRDHPLSQTLAQLHRSPVFHSSVLGGLDSGDVGLFLRAASGSEASTELADAIYSHTEGNPFFMSEVIRLLVERGELEEVSATGGPVTLGIPQGVREVIDQRLARLSENCVQVLTTASVIGRQFDFRLLRTLSAEVTEDEVLQAIDEAVRSHLIEESDGLVESYQFSHAMVQQTLSGELTTSRKIRLHARIAETLEGIYAGDERAHAEELAYHFAEAQTVLGTEKLVMHSLAAGEKALDVYAYEEALVHFQKGLAARSGQPADDDTAKLWAGLGRCQVATLPLFQLDEAVASLRKAFDHYAETGNADQAVAIAELPFPPSAGRDYGVLQMIERALALVPATSQQAGRLLARYGWLQGIEKANYEEGRDALAQALDIAQSEGDTALAVRTLVSAAEVEAFFFHYGETITKSLEAINLLSQIDDPRSETMAHFWAGNASIYYGDPIAAKRHITQSIVAAQRLRHHFYLGRALNQMCWISYRLGEWQAARDFSDQGLEASPRETRLLHTRMLLEYEVGNFSDGEAYLVRLLDVMRLTAPGPAYEYAFPAMSIPMAARISGNLGWIDEAEKAAGHVLSSPSVTPMVAAMTSTGLALLAVQRGDVAAAQKLYAANEPPETFGGLGPLINRTIGLLAQTAGSVDEAIGHFEDALAHCRKAGFRPELAWTCCDYADALLERDGDEDRAKAMSLLDESLAVSRELSMRPLMERVLSRQENLKA